MQAKLDPMAAWKEPQQAIRTPETSRKNRKSGEVSCGEQHHDAKMIDKQLAFGTDVKFSATLISASLTFYSEQVAKTSNSGTPQLFR